MKNINCKGYKQFLAVMKKSYLLNVIGIFILLSFVKISAQTGDVSFQTISIESGLSQSTVFAVCQDKKGFLWLGTNDGLNRYDGYNFVVYKPDPEDPGSISGNRVFSIFEDSRGDLWIGTEGGLSRFDRINEKFVSFRHQDNSQSLINNQVHTIVEDDEGKLWLGTRNGISVYDRVKNSFTNYQNDPKNPKSLSNNFVWKIYKDKNGNIWVGTDRGLNKFIKAKNNFERYFLANDPSNKLFRNTVFSILEDHKGNLWVGTRNGLFKRSPQNEKFTLIENNPSDVYSLSNNNVYTIWEDSKNNLWIGTLGGGLNLLVDQTSNNKSHVLNKFIHYKNDLKHSNSISNNFIWSIFEDKSGILWIGTDIGLNKYDPFHSNFRLIQADPGNNNSIISNDVTAIFLDSDSLLWIGTRNGLSCYNEKNKIIVNYNLGKKPDIGLRNNYVKSLYEDSHKILWVGTNGGGLIRYNKRNSQFKIFTANANKPGALSDDKIMSICEDSYGVLWIGTLGGVNKYDRKSEKFTCFKHDPGNPNSLSYDYVYNVFEDRDKILWVGTMDGLNKYDRKNNKFVRYSSIPNENNSLSNNLIMSIAEDMNGNLWIGTNGGLNEFNKKSEKFIRYGERDILISGVIYGIIQDESGSLWLSTNRGLTKFDPQSKIIRNYTERDGLQSNQFNSGAYFKDKNGTMYFGGINGLNIFNPSEIKINSVIPNVVFTNFQVFNKQVKIGNDSQLKESISETKEITLSYKDNVFSFEFASLHYASPVDNKFAYMMTGFDKEWQFSKSRRFVTYTNLDPGEYVFKIKGSNSDGIWNETGASIRIIITPPFWRTWWFILAMVILISGIAYLMFYLRMRHLLDIESIRFNIAADLHDDIGTKLTEISMLSDMVYHFAPIQQKSEFESIKKIGQIARTIVDNLSDLIWIIKPEKDTLKELFLKLKDSHEEILNYSNIVINYNNFEILDSIRLSMETRKTLLMIFKEALNNCIKYSKCSKVTFTSEVSGSDIMISLNDNGIGFDVNQKTRGNGLDNMEKRAKLIKGTVLVHSAINQGTTITFMGRIK